MGVFYDVRVHLAESADDYQGKKSSTVAMGIRKVKILVAIFGKKSRTLANAMRIRKVLVFI